jgi:hypothetical protein
MKGSLGRIEYPAAAQQLRNWESFVYNTCITPTDIDGGFDIFGKVFVFIELKRYGAKFRREGGQGMFLANIGDALTDAGKDSIVIIARHSTPTHEIVSGGETRVEQYRRNKAWVNCSHPWPTIKEFLNPIVKSYWPKMPCPPTNQ